MAASRRRIRSLEPTGLVGLARALIHQRQFQAAAEVVTKLNKTSWPSRFETGPENLPEKIRAWNGI